MGHINSGKNRRGCGREGKQCELLQRELVVSETMDVRPAAGVGSQMLTKREAQVAELVSQGFANKTIAQQLGLREGTVKIHVHNIYQKLRVPNRTSLILSWIAKRVEYR
jgi:DNA-binding NarL/FixJ family response regulator